MYIYKLVILKELNIYNLYKNKISLYYKMDKKLNAPAYTRRCVDKYNKKKEEYPEIYKERKQKINDAQKKNMKNMKENEPEKYQAYLEKMRVYLKMRRDKMHELKNSKKINIQKYILNLNEI